jgi:hypothetical protein
MSLTPFTSALPLVLLGAIAAPLGAAWADAPGQGRRSNAQLQEAQALARLSTPDLHNYFESRRQLERRSSDQRLAELRRLEDCLERTRQRSGADACLDQAQEQRVQERQQALQQLSSLRQRYGLPALPGVQPPLQSWMPSYQPQQAWRPGYQPQPPLPQPRALPVAPNGWF